MVGEQFLERMAAKGSALVQLKADERAERERMRVEALEAEQAAVLQAFRETAGLTAAQLTALDARVLTLQPARVVLQPYGVEILVEVRRSQPCNRSRLGWPASFRGGVADEHVDPRQALALAVAWAKRQHDTAKAEILKRLGSDRSDQHLYREAEKRAEKVSGLWESEPVRAARAAWLRREMPRVNDNEGFAWYRTWEDYAREMDDELAPEIEEVHQRRAQLQALLGIRHQIEKLKARRISDEDLGKLINLPTSLGVPEMREAPWFIEALEELAERLRQIEADDEREANRRELQDESFYPFAYYLVTYAVYDPEAAEGTVAEKTIECLQPDPVAGWWRTLRGQMLKLGFVVAVERREVLSLVEMPAWQWVSTSYGAVKAPPDGVERLTATQTLP